jgi:hypothetical protein
MMNFVLCFKESVSSLCGKIIIFNFLPKIIKNHLKWGLRFLYFYYWLKNCEYCFKGIDMSQISPLNQPTFRIFINNIFRCNWNVIPLNYFFLDEPTRNVTCHKFNYHIQKISLVQWMCSNIAIKLWYFGCNF